MKKIKLVIAALMFMASIPAFAQEEDNGEYQLSGFKKFSVEELIRVIEHSVENLTLQELEALYYDMSTKNYINE